MHMQMHTHKLQPRIWAKRKHFFKHIYCLQPCCFLIATINMLKTAITFTLNFLSEIVCMCVCVCMLSVCVQSRFLAQDARFTRLCPLLVWHFFCVGQWVSELWAGSDSVIWYNRSFLLGGGRTFGVVSPLGSSEGTQPEQQCKALL